MTDLWGRIYDLQKARDALLKYGFALAAIEFSQIKEVPISIFGTGALKLDQLGVRVIGGVLFFYLTALWAMSLAHHFFGLRGSTGQSTDIRKLYTEIVDGLKPLSRLEKVTIAFEIGAPIMLIACYTSLILTRG